MSAKDVPTQRVKRKKLSGWIVGVCIALAASVTALALVLFGVIPGIGGSSGDDLVLEAADAPGAAAFMVADLVKPSSLITPIKKGAPVPAVNLTPTPAAGGTPGLYGGTGAETCNAGQIVSFLGQNPDKAAAWVGALNADPNLRWGTGQPLTVAEIPLFMANLLPVVLQADTWVTNHGFSGSAATPFQSMLQRGTSVFVDRYGVPRVRCLCGNPMLPPKAIDNPRPQGDPWEGFGETPPATITPEPQPLSELQVTGGDGQLVTQRPPMCSDPRIDSCPAPGPENATMQPPGGNASGDPANPASPTTGFYLKDNPVAPQFDVCSANYVVTEMNPANVTFSVTNNSAVEVDLWAPNMTWDENFNITSCAAVYTGTFPAGTIGDSHSPPGMTWVAVDSTTGAVLSTNENTGTAWSIS